MTRRFAAIAAVAVTVAGCGGGGHSDVSSAAKAYGTALAGHDFAAACRAMTPTFARLTVASLAARLARSAPPGPCPVALRGVLKGVPSTTLDVTASDVRVHGDAATVKLAAGGGGGGDARLQRGADGRWRVSCCVAVQIDKEASETYRVPSAAMEPTLRLGQEVKVDQRAYRSTAPRRGEIILAHPPLDVQVGACANRGQGREGGAPCGRVVPREDVSQRFVKRVVAVPGDRVALRAGRVVLNGTLQAEPYIRRCSALPQCNYPKAVRVPAGTYFVLGDNRGESDDSRFWGPVPQAWIVGRVRQNP